MLKPLLLNGLVLIAFCCSRADAAIVVIGDSLSDNGNAFQLTGGVAGAFFAPAPGTFFPTPPFNNGRASNGLLWVEQLAQALGVPVPQPGFVNPALGTNMAVIGATTGALGSVSPFGSPSMFQQLAVYLSANVPAPSDLFVVWGGANDFLGGQTNPAIVVGQISQIIQALAASGARQFLVPNLSLIGDTPILLLPGRELERAGLNALTVGFNNLLAGELASLRTLLPGITIHELDVFGLFAAARSNPAAFGFTNVSQSAVAFDPLTGIPLFPTQVVPNPNEYLFWDFVHPSAATHSLLGAAAVGVVTPEPSSMSLWLVVAGLSLGWSRFRRCRSAVAA